MAVRRLAEDAVQPQAFKFSGENARWAKETIKKYPAGRQASAVIPLLMRAQEQDGWVTKASIEAIAEMLEMPYIRVLEVATFYTQFQLAPVGTKAHVQVCGTTPCMLRGSEALMEVCKRKIHPDQFHTNSDGTLSWEEVECQGACVNAPMVMIFKDTYEDLTPERLEEIIDAFENDKGETVKPGPQVDRIYSAPEGELTSLNSDFIDRMVSRKVTAKGNSTAKLARTASKLNQPKKSEIPAEPEANSTLKLAQTAAGKKPAAKKEAPMKKAAKPKPYAPEGDPKIKGPAKSSGPERLKKPNGNADDLKLIAGVGPKLEQTLNTLGFWHFEQIAKWKKSDIAIVDDELSFKGRIERDDWVRQARALAKGGEAEHIKVFGKKPR